MKKFAVKFTALLLSMLLATQTLNMAYAAEPSKFVTESPYSSSADVTEPDNVQDSAEPKDSQAQIVTEYLEKRTENTKTFLMDDGTFLRASYNEPIHYKDSTDTWQDIDNTLNVTNAKALASAQVMENKAGNTKFKLSKTIKSGNTISLKSGNLSVSWGLDGANTAASQIVDNLKDTNSESHNDQFLKLKKLHNEILYKDALPGIDVQYLISSNTAKENIILKTKDTQKQFTETYQIGDLTAKQVDDKTIELFEKPDADQEKPVYTISAPLMSDANGIISDAVEISILQQNAGMLKIALHTDETWLNAPERAYPVTIDPEVEIPGVTNYGIHDTFVASGTGYSGSNNDTMGTMYIGNETAKYKTCRILVKFDLPQLNKGDMIVGAQLNLSQLSAGMDPSTATMQINAYEMKSSWDASTATWNNTSSAVDSATKGNILDYFTASQATAGSWNSWDVTKAVKNWYNGATNYGFVLKAQDEAAAARNIYFTSNYPNGESSYPYMMISFVNNAGLEDYWSYHSQSAGRAGTGAVNDYTGNLVFSTPVMNTTGERAPLNFSITYNNYRYGTHFEDQLKGDIFGWGWQSNLSERVDSVKEDSGTNAQEKEKFKMLAARGYKFIYLDEDGTEHYFKADGSKIIDEDGLGLEMTSGGAGNEYYTMLYPDGSKKTFTESGYLYRIYDNEGNYLTLSYYGSYLNKVTDGADRETIIDYSGTGAVTKITGPDNKETKFYYTGGNLTSITYPDNKTIQYSYDASNQLQRVTNVDGTYIQYTYYDGTTPMVKNRVKETAEYSAAGALGNKVSFTYNTDNTTTFTYYKVVQTYAPQQETFTFDRVGRTTSVLNMDGSATAYKYTGSSEKLTKKNKIISQAATHAPVNNILLNHNAERNDGTWTGSNWSSPGGTFSVDSSQSYLGSRSLKIEQKGQTNPARSGAMQKLTNLTPGSTYTLSGYVKTDGVTGGMGANLYVACFNNSTSLITFNGTGTFGTNNWQRTSVTFTVPENTNRVEIYGGLSYANGTAWFDCLQLEAGNLANLYNLVENGDFSYYNNTNYIPTNWTPTDFTSGDGMTGGWVRIFGNPTLKKEISQEISIGKPANSIAFIASAKSTGKSVPISGNRRYEINVNMYFTDGTNREFVVPFNPDTTGTQYTSGPIVATTSDERKTILKLIYSIKYYQNENDANFKHLQLNMDETGTTYTYDDNGQLKTSKQNAKNLDTYGYSDEKELVSSQTQYTPTDFNQNYVYTYEASLKQGGNPHRLKSVRLKKDDTTTTTDTGQFYAYDNSGNINTTYMGNINDNGELLTEDPYISTSQYYDSKENYITSSVDQRGKTTRYTVNSTTGITSSIEDPNGYFTYYDYEDPNNSNLLTSVRAQSSAGEVENKYYYDSADRLNKITHNGFDYTFARDGYGNTTIINAGSRNLIKNIFYSGNGNLWHSDYGNGFELFYEYDAYDRVKSVKKNNLLAYEYLYDARGNLAKITDKTSGSDVVTTFSYNLGDQLTKQSSTDGSTIQYSYDNMNRSTNTTYTFADQTKQSSYKYTEDNLKGTSTLLNQESISHTYDPLYRETATSIHLPDMGKPTLSVKRSFVSDPNSKATTTLIGTYTNERSSLGEDTPTILSQYQYAYDDNGNISTIEDKDGNTVSYDYDDLNQLVRVNDQKAGISTTYSYDAGGNITETIAYPYTTGTLGTPLNNGMKTYDYSDDDWKDLLTSYNGQEISYDNIGNPLRYREGNNGKQIQFTWEGRQLKTAVANGKNLSYTYNSDGTRTSKTVDNVTTNYLLDGSTIMAQKSGSDVMWFVYDSDGTRVGFTYNGATYHYLTNAQGDVTGITDVDDNLVVEYSYDAWGKLLYVTDSTGDAHIGQKNPFLYRGYYYDSETGLYYLNSRYYDSQTGRFLNADEQLNLNTGLIGTNLFTYCSNNSVNYDDPNGTIAGIDDLAYLAIGFTVGIAIISIFYITTTPIATQSWNGLGNAIGNTVEKLSRSISKTIEDAKAKIRNSKNRYQYWAAAKVDFGNGYATYVPTVGLSKASATSYVKSGKNVFAASSILAKQLATAVGNGASPDWDGPHGGLGYFPHYHAKRVIYNAQGIRKYERIGGHVFYL